MKILQLGKFYPVKGGVEKVMYDIAEGLSKEKIRCDMLCVSLKTKSFVKQVNENFNIYSVEGLAKFAATMIAPDLALKLHKIHTHYDIIHIHHPDPMAAFALLLSGYKGKVILHWHSDILKQKFLLKLYNPIQSWLINRADLILGTSPIYTRQSVFLKEHQKKIRTLPIGVAPVVGSEEKKRIIRSKYNGKKIVFSLGRLVEYKGYEYLIRAANHLPSDYVILIGGDGPQRNILESLILELNLSERVFLLGRIDNSDLASYYIACDIFCLSSIWKTEAFAIVQIEAMSAGKPVVATNIIGSGVSWVNKDGVSGINVEPQDPKALAAAIEFILNDNKRYGEFCKGAIERYSSLFTREIMIEKCVELYRTLL